MYSCDSTNYRMVREYSSEMSVYILINKAALEVKGAVKATICYEKMQQDEVALRVVPDGTMRHNVLLGRNIIYAFGLKLVRKNADIDNITKYCISNQVCLT